MTHKQKIVLITGGIGSGKSLVLNLLKNKFKKRTISADEINKSLLNQSDYINEIKESFPTVVCKNKINKAELSKIVFSDSKQLKLLESIAHKHIEKKLFEFIVGGKEDIYIEISAYNKKILDKANEIWYIDSCPKERINRCLERDKKSRLEIEKIIKAQDKFCEICKEKATHIISNNGTVSELLKNIKCIIN